MEITFFHKNLQKEEEGIFVEYVNSKLESIHTLLKKFADDSAILRISIEKFEKHHAFEVEFDLSLPSNKLIAKETSHEINKSVDLARDRLLGQIKKHLAHLRKDRSRGLTETELDKKAK